MWAVAAALAQSAATVYDEAVSDLRGGNPAAAISRLEGALRDSPDDLKARTLLGMALSAAGRREEARREFQKVLAVNPRFAPALRNLALTEAAAGDAKQAEQHFETLLRIAPGDPMAYIALAEMAVAVHDYKKASEVLGLLPKQADPSLHYRGGTLFATLGDYSSAAREFEMARPGREKDFDLGYNLALAYLRNRQPGMAVRTAQEWIANGNAKAELYNLLAQALEKTGRTKEAYEALRAATRIDPADEANYIDLIALCIAHKNYDLALEIANVGASRLPASDRLELQRGIVFAIKGQFDEARASFERTRRLAPAKSTPAVALALILMQTNRTSEAIEVLRRNTRGDYLTLWFLGEALNRSGATPGSPEYGEALDALERSVKLNGEVAQSRVLLAKLLARTGSLEDAEAHLEQALRLDPDNVTATYQLAQICSRRGEAARARELFARVSKAKSDDREQFTTRGIQQILREGAQ